MRTSGNSIRGFTFIEVSVMIVIITVLSALVLPNVVRMAEANRKRQFFSSLWHLAGNAHELAIMDRRTMSVRLDSSGRAFKLVEQPSPSTSGSQQTQQDAGDDEERERDSLDVPVGIDTGNFTSDGNNTDSANWEVKFYPDGTSDGGGLEVTDNGRVRSLVIRRDGSLNLIEGPMPELDEEKWPAGEIEKRGGG
ncbi:MAG TPA: type II secretion system protein [Gemmatimonadales bacterium]|nr:type II secretion system protein [Gemmatimonadales bacterium]